MKSHRWYIYIFWHTITLAVINAWLLYKRDCKACKIPKKEILNRRGFQAQLASSLILVNSISPLTSMTVIPQRPVSALRRLCVPPMDVRKDKVAHFPVKSKRGRCRHCDKGYTNTLCRKCSDISRALQWTGSAGSAWQQGKIQDKEACSGIFEPRSKDTHNRQVQEVQQDPTVAKKYGVKGGRNAFVTVVIHIGTTNISDRHSEVLKKHYQMLLDTARKNTDARIVILWTSSHLQEAIRAVQHILWAAVLAPWLVHLQQLGLHGQLVLVLGAVNVLPEGRASP
ncbi:hypothetical protein SRHO_G00032090 [Serrasalmus rhombeus]